MASALARSLVLTSVLVALVALGTGPAPAGRAPSKSASVPFEMLPTNHMLVRAKINGKGPYDLIFDVGAPITLLTNRAGLGPGTIKPDAPRSFLFSIRGESQVESLEVGELKAA